MSSRRLPLSLAVAITGTTTAVSSVFFVTLQLTDERDLSSVCPCARGEAGGEAMYMHIYIMVQGLDGLVIKSNRVV